MVGVPKLYGDEDLRLSYVIWQEGVSPHIIVELLSPSTEKEDLGESRVKVSQNGNSQNATAEKPPAKWDVYEKSHPNKRVAAQSAATRLLGLCPNKTSDSYN